MPLKVDDQIPRSVMFLCLGTAVMLGMAQWASSTRQFAHSGVGIIRPARRAVAIAQPINLEKPVNPENPVATPAPVKAEPQTDTRLLVSLSDRKVSLYKANKLQASYPIAVAQAGWETPTGDFKVFNMEQNPKWVHPITGETIPPGSNNPLGVAWIGFWTDGESEIGFHGTNQEQLIGEAVSHGCLRMRNADIKAIFAQVSEGTPVIVQK